MPGRVNATRTDGTILQAVYVLSIQENVLGWTGQEDVKGKQNMCECELQCIEVVLCVDLGFRTPKEQGQKSRSPYLEVVINQLIISN